MKVALQGVEEFRREGFEVIVLDTAGRHKDEERLIDEMQVIAQTVTPDEIVLVVDGTIGQQAASQAQAFHEATEIGSIVITKLDGSARGGGALSAVAATGAPIKFIGTGESVEDQAGPLVGGGLRGDVPQGHVDGADGGDHDALAAVIGRAPVESRPDGRGVVCVATDQEGSEELRHSRLDHTRRAVGLPPADGLAARRSQNCRGERVWDERCECPRCAGKRAT